MTFFLTLVIILNAQMIYVYNLLMTATSDTWIVSAATSG
jgi:hypothetical protein